MVILEKHYSEKVKLVKLLGSLENKYIKNIVDQIKNISTPYEKTNDFILQAKDQEEIQKLTCMEWNLYPSQTMMLAYPKYLPLKKSDLQKSQRKLYRKDLSKFITLVTENAARPVDYWFITNKYWNIEKETNDDFILIPTSNNKVSLTSSEYEKIILPKDAFIPAISNSLRNYKDFPPIIPYYFVDNYFLIDEKRPDVKKYYKWGQEAHNQDLFGSSHSTYTPAKNSGGIVKKIDFYHAKTLALRFVKPMMGRRCISFGFHSEKSQNADLFFAYLTSSLFLLDAIEKSRKRRAEFVIIYQIDFQMKFRFPNFELIEKNKVLRNEILESSEKFNTMLSMKDRPTLPEMIRLARNDPEYPLRKLDRVWFNALSLPLSYLDIMYTEIEERLKDIVSKKK